MSVALNSRPDNLTGWLSPGLGADLVATSTGDAWPGTTALEAGTTRILATVSGTSARWTLTAAQVTALLGDAGGVACEVVTGTGEAKRTVLSGTLARRNRYTQGATGTQVIGSVLIGPAGTGIASVTLDGTDLIVTLGDETQLPPVPLPSVEGLITDATQAASDAQAAQVAAEAAQTAAEGAATAAGLSESAAAGSASAALASEQAAALSESASAQSALDAGTAQGLAEDARDAASGYADDAAASAALAIQDTVNSGAVDNTGHLILTKNDATTVDAGYVVGPQGAKGDTGAAATIAAGTTTTGAAGSSASVTNSGTSSAAVFDFTIPRGDTGATGATGAAATVTAGTTTTGAAGSSASVSNSGTSSAAVFNFTIPRGDTGATGTAATIAAGTTTTGAAGSSASVTNGGTSSAAVFNFTIPRGDTGATGATGATGDSTAYVGINAQTDSYTVVASDLGKLVTFNKATGVNCTLPQDSDATFAIGARVDVVAIGAGMVTFVAGSGATVNGTPSLVTRAQWSAATAVKRAANTWLVVGDLA